MGGGPASVHMALLATFERLDAVLVWTDAGERHLRLLSVAEPDRADSRALVGGPPTSAGRTWQTWTLPSVPVELRHLPPARAATALALRLAG